MKNRREMIAGVGAAAVTALAGTRIQAAEGKVPTAKAIVDEMKETGIFFLDALKLITEKTLQAARDKAKNKKIKGLPLEEKARVIYQGTNLFNDNGVWRWMGPGCNGNTWYYYRPQPGAYVQALGQCPNNRFLYNINVV
jgi:hypothetical protein